MKYTYCRIVLCLFVLMGAFSSCDYDVDSLPDFKPDYSIAFPIGDTLINNTVIVDPLLELLPFPIIDDNTVIPPMIIFNEIMSYTVYIQDLQGEDYLMEWLEPKFIITNDCPSKFQVSTSIYLETKDDNRHYLIDNYTLTQGKQTLMGTSESRIDLSSFSEFYNTERIAYSLYIEIKEPVTFKELKNAAIRVQIAVKAKISENI